MIDGIEVREIVVYDMSFIEDTERWIGRLDILSKQVQHHITYVFNVVDSVKKQKRLWIKTRKVALKVLKEFMDKNNIKKEDLEKLVIPIDYKQPEFMI